MNPRLSLGLGLLFTWLLAPWWLVLGLMVLGISWYGFYPEALVASLLIDLTGSQSLNFFGHPFGLTLIIVVFLAVVPIVRARLYTR